jgi:hypothetical protein
MFTDSFPQSYQKWGASFAFSLSVALLILANVFIVLYLLIKGKDVFKLECMAHTVERLETKLWVAETKEVCLLQDLEDEIE